MAQSAVLGFPSKHPFHRYTHFFPHHFLIPNFSIHFLGIGPNREVKKAVESYWAFKTSAEDLDVAVKAVRKQRWESIKAQGVHIIPR